MAGVALYADMTPDVASAARAAAERIRVRFSRAAADIIAIGRDLALQKQALGHGHYIAWIEAEFGMTDRTALNFTRVFDRFGSKSEIVSDLPPTVLYALAAPSTPENVREEVMRRADAGEPVTLETVMDLKRQLVDAKDASKAAKQDIKVQKSEAQRAKDERDRVRNELDFANARIRQQAEEIERLKQDNTIHVYPPEPEPLPALSAVRPAPKPAPRSSCLRTAAALAADKFDFDTAEFTALLREAGQLSLAAEIEAVVAEAESAPVTERLTA